MNGKRRRHATTYGVLAGAAGLMLVLAACEARVPTASEVEAMDVAAAEKQAVTHKIYDARAAKADYFLDGVQVTAAQAHAIDGKDLGSIDIVKSENRAGRDTIFLTSRSRMPKDNLIAKIASKGDELETPTLERTPLPPGAAPQMASAEKLRLPDDPSVVLMIDGKESTRAQLAALDPAMIKSITVYKSGPELTERSRTATGLIDIRTRVSPERRSVE